MAYTGITGTVQGAAPNYDQGVICGGNLDLSGVLPAGQVGNCFSADGELWIGSTALTAGGTHARIGNITSSDGSIHVENSSGNIDLSGTAQGFQPNAVLQEFDDFIEGSANSEPFSKLHWLTGPSGTYNVNGTADHPGILSSVPAIGTNSSLYLLSTDDVGQPTGGPFVFGGGALTISWVIQLSALSAGGDTYIFTCGLADSFSLNEVTWTGPYVNGCYFSYTNTVNSGNYQIKNTASSVTTTANTSTAATTDWTTFTISVNAGGTSVRYLINNVEVANSPLATNIPTAAITPFFFAENTAGTNPPINVDLFWVTYNLSNPRPGPISGDITADNRFFGNYVQTGTNYQVLGTDAIIGVSSTAAARTITMPNSGVIAGQWWRIKDESGGAGTNNITLNGNGYLIDGAATAVINTNYGSYDIYFNGAAYYLS